MVPQIANGGPLFQIAIVLYVMIPNGNAKSADKVASRMHAQPL